MFINHKKWLTLSLSYGVNLLSSLKIVNSNAFVFSTCLLEIVFRYGFILFLSCRFICFSLFINKRYLYCFSRTLITLTIRLLQYSSFDVVLYFYNTLYFILFILFYSSFNPLGKILNLETVLINSISFRRGFYPFSLLMPALSLE